MPFRIRGRYKPQGVTLSIDTDTSVNEGLLYALPYDQAVYHDRAYGVVADPAVYTNLQQATGSAGKCVISSAVGDGRQTFSGVRFPADDCDWTMRWVFELSTTAGNQCLIRSSTGGSLTSFYIFGAQACVYNSGSGSNPVGIGPTLTANTLYDLTITHVKTATQFEFFLNGESLGFQSPALLNASCGMTGTLNLWGDPFTSFTQWIQGKRYLFTAWNRVLNYGEIVENYHNFWRSFTRPGIFPVGAASGAIVSPTLYSFIDNSDQMIGWS